jgi:hypothetical protein
MAEPPTLAELQRHMLAALRGGTGTLPAETTTLAAHVCSDHRLSGAERLQIYADMYFWRLLEVLRGAFPRLLVFLGDDDFAALCARFVAVHPSRHPSLRLLGDQLAAFMRADAQPAWAADLAALEWARYDVFDEADATPLTRETLRTQRPEAFAELPIALVPAHRWLPLDHPVEAAWRALRPQSDPTTFAAPAPAPRTLLVWRQDDTVYHRALASEEVELLQLARAGTSFGIICETLAAALDATSEVLPEAAAERAFALLARWVDDGLLCAAP